MWIIEILNWLLLNFGAQIALAALIFYLLYRFGVFNRTILRRIAEKGYDGYYIIHHAQYSRKLNKKSNDAMADLEEKPLYLYRPFRIKFKLRNSEGEVIHYGNETIVTSKALPKEMVEGVVDAFSKQPLNANIVLGEKIRRVVDMINVEDYIKATSLDDLYIAFKVLKQDIFQKDPALLKLYEYVRIYLLENQENYKLLREIKQHNPDLVVMILNSIERGIINGRF